MKTQELKLSQAEARLSRAFTLLKDLIRIPSFSGGESAAADRIVSYLSSRGVERRRKGNNVWAYSKHYDAEKPTLLLNSHLDTVKPSSAWTVDPFGAQQSEGKLFGLGSNDAGAALVCLAETFCTFQGREGLGFNLVFAATAEEENSGEGGIESILTDLGPLHAAIVGEPTGMRMATAQKGLMVLDCVANGKPGHAARGEGVNAIYESLNDIDWFRKHRFGKDSVLLGPVMMSVTCIQAGKQHNVVPGECHFTVDIRSTDTWTNEMILEEIKKNVKCEVHPRSMRLRPVCIPHDHILVKAGLELDLQTFGSPTLSDAALIPVPSLKLGPGESSRSHTADEFIYLEELEQGLKVYHELIEKVIL